MRNVTIAEWILSRVTAQGRAASIVGDLAEEAPARGVLWFWWNVLRTAASHVGRKPTASGGALGPIFGGEEALGLIFGLVIGAVWTGLIVVGNLGGTTVLGNVRDTHPGFNSLIPIFGLGAIVVIALAGMASARRTGSIGAALRIGLYSGFISGVICLVVVMSITILFHDAMMLDPSNIREFALSAKRPPTQAELSHFLYWDALGGGVNMLWLGPLLGVTVGAVGAVFGKWKAVGGIGQPSGVNPPHTDG